MAAGELGKGENRARRRREGAGTAGPGSEAATRRDPRRGRGSVAMVVSCTERVDRELRMHRRKQGRKDEKDGARGTSLEGRRQGGLTGTTRGGLGRPSPWVLGRRCSGGEVDQQEETGARGEGPGLQERSGEAARGGEGRRDRPGGAGRRRRRPVEVEAAGSRRGRRSSCACSHMSARLFPRVVPGGSAKDEVERGR